MNISVKEAKNRLSELLHLAEKGETVVLTRHGKPVADLVPHRLNNGGINWEALAAYKKTHGITWVVDYIPEDFDDPLPRNFLMTPLNPE